MAQSSQAVSNAAAAGVDVGKSVDRNIAVAECFKETQRGSQ